MLPNSVDRHNYMTYLAECLAGSEDVGTEREQLPEPRCPVVVRTARALTYELTVDFVTHLDVLDAVTDDAAHQQVARLRAHLPAHVLADILCVIVTHGCRYDKAFSQASQKIS